MIEKNNHYYLLIKNATGKDKINLINKEIERCYEILTHIIKTSKLNTEIVSGMSMFFSCNAR